MLSLLYFFFQFFSMTTHGFVDIISCSLCVICFYALYAFMLIHSIKRLMWNFLRFFAIFCSNTCFGKLSVIISKVIEHIWYGFCWAGILKIGNRAHQVPIITINMLAPETNNTWETG